ncbi:hypothetical protein ACFQMA_17130 [Halosimplex aquaticum]|uniref:WD40-like Beta Propeller Repeat n=1 Tax=Halosimplex aquaticum TaxID=3026162 RepID=A0ABD5Y266_9EURY|nr:hypothetical protein [Halosimplex aquaticum]
MTDPGLAETPRFRRVPREGIDRYRLVDPTRSVGPRRVAPVSTDRSVWLYAGGETPTLGVLDAETGAVQSATAATPDGPTPLVDAESGTAYVLDGHAVAAHDPERPAEPRSVGRFDPGTVPGTAAAGLTRSADGEQFAAVFATDDESRLVTLSAEEGTTAVWHTRDRRYDTVRFSPSDASLALLARDATDGVGGEAWLAREGLGARPLGQLLPDHHSDLRWNEGGTGLWYVEPRRGVGLVHLEAGRRERVWATSAREADATRDGDLLAATVADGESVRVSVYDRRDDRERTLSDPVPVSGAWTPRPQFVCGDRWLLYTATIDGVPRVTLVSVDALR